MPFENQDESITIPEGAGPGEIRIFLGTSGLPPPLDTYLYNNQSPVKAAIIFFHGISITDDYMFLALFEDLDVVGTETNLILQMGHVRNGVVVEESGLFPKGMLWYLDQDTGDIHMISRADFDTFHNVVQSRTEFNLTPVGELQSRWFINASGMGFGDGTNPPDAFITHGTQGLIISGSGTGPNERLIVTGDFMQHLVLTRAGLASNEFTVSTSHHLGSNIPGTGTNANAMRFYVGGVPAFSSNAGGFYVPGTMQVDGMATQFNEDATNINGISSTSYTAVGSSAFCGVAFIAPPSGKGTIYHSMLCDMNTSDFSTHEVLSSPRLRNGLVIGAGTDVFAASDSCAVMYGAGNPNFNAMNFRHVSGLTPGNGYNAHLEHRVTQAAHTGDISHRQIKWVPDLA